jgi:hypothetical protein
MRILSVLLVSILAVCMGCDGSTTSKEQTKSASGVSKTTVEVTTGSDGLTVEQRNIKDRYALENKAGSIKHLYIISPYSGQVLMYSTVKGKVTSSSKRLTPKTVSSDDGEFVDSDFKGAKIAIGDRWFRTSEVLQDDGTYGDSSEYLYWFDVNGKYHQHYLGNEILHISDQPIAVKGVILNLSQNN